MTTTPSEMVAMGRTDDEHRLDQIRVALLIAAGVFLAVASLIATNVINF